MKKSRAEKKPASMQRDLAERFLKKRERKWTEASVLPEM